MWPVIRASGRLGRVLVHVLYGLLLVQLRFPSRSVAWQQQTTQRWALYLLQILQVQLKTNSVPASLNGGALFVANHISWLDIVLLLAICPCRFVAKAEIKHWPLLGKLAQANHSIFLQRQRLRAIKDAKQALNTYLLGGAWVVVFPESTTSAGTSTVSFHANLFQAAIDTQCPVLPLALGYFDPKHGSKSTAAAYAGNTSMLGSVWRTLRVHKLCAQVSFGTLLTSGAGDINRKTLAAQAQVQVQALQENMQLANESGA